MKKHFEKPVTIILKFPYMDIFTSSCVSVGDERTNGTYDDAAVQGRQNIW